jgi:hypothetical protein
VFFGIQIFPTNYTIRKLHDLEKNIVASIVPPLPKVQLGERRKRDVSAKSNSKRLVKMTWLAKFWKKSQKHSSNRLAIYPTSYPN